jgi:hypothetical protein
MHFCQNIFFSLKKSIFLVDFYCKIFGGKVFQIMYFGINFLLPLKGTKSNITFQRINLFLNFSGIYLVQYPPIISIFKFIHKSFYFLLWYIFVIDTICSLGN